MDMRTGEIVDMDEVLKKAVEEQKYFKPLPLTLNMVRKGRVALDDLCPCTSGKVFGECCYMGKKR